MLLVSFIVLMALLFVVLVVSLRKILNRNVVSATAHLEQVSAEYAKREEQIRKQLEDTQRQCKEIVENAQKDAQQKREEIIKQSQEDKEKVVNEAKQKAEDIIKQADKTRNTLIAEIDQKIEERALKRAAELIQQAVPENVRQEIHNRWLDDLISSRLQQLERLHLPEGKLEAKIISAFTLNAKQREAVKNKIKEKIGRNIDLKEEVDAAVIAGLIIKIGSLVLDGSLRFKIQEAASSQSAK